MRRHGHRLALRGLGVWVGLIWGLGAAPVAFGQAERYELGRRLRVFEAAWDRADAESRKRATPPLKEAVNRFFSLRFGDAGERVDEARHALDPASKPDADRRWAESLWIKLGGRLLDARSPRLSLAIAAFHKTTASAPPDARLRIAIDDSDRLFDEAIGALPQSWEAPIAKAGEGDRILRFAIESRGEILAESRQTVSFVKDRDARLKALADVVKAWDQAKAPATTDRKTVESLLELLQGLAKGRTLETDYPCARLLAEAEDAARAVNEGRTFYDRSRTGQFWQTLALSNRRLAYVRIQVPGDADAQGPLRPLAIALHGAGGSENMFFDSYGDGAIAKECARRGWILVAPRLAGFGGAQVTDIIDEITGRYPVDRRRVVLVGHSMGAAQAIASALSSPDRFAAVAALGGGRAARAVPGLESLPFFVGVGGEDFAIRGARALRDSLQQAGLKTLRYEEYPQIEHLAVVAAALPDVMAFFEARLKAPPR